MKCTICKNDVSMMGLITRNISSPTTDLIERQTTYKCKPCNGTIIIISTYPVKE